MRLVHNSLHDEVAAQLRERIFAGELAPGSLPRRGARWREQLEISRTPLREALKVLTAEGLVRHEPRRGCFVNRGHRAGPGRDLPGDRAAGRPLRLRGRAQRQRRRPAGAGGAARQAGNATPRRSRINEYYAANFAIHEAIITLADNRWLAQVIGDLRKIVKLARLQQLHAPGRLEQSLSEHLAVFAALKARDAEGAEAAMRTHLTRQREALRELARNQRTRGWPHECRSDWLTRGVSRCVRRRRAQREAARRQAPRRAAGGATARAPEGHAAPRRRGAVAARAAPHAGRTAGHRRSAA